MRKVNRTAVMKGVEFVVDEKGKKKAVLIDLKKHGGLPPVSG